MRDSAVRNSRLFVAVAVVLAVLSPAVAVADPLIFGIHDHVTAEDTQSPHSHPAHHCDLSMSPAVVAPASGVTAPIATSSAVIDDRGHVPQSSPFAPLRPPRA